MDEAETRPTSEREPTIDDAPIDPANAMGRSMRGLLAAYLVAVCGLLLYLFGKFWPSELKGTALPAQAAEQLFWWGYEVKTSAEVRILVLVLCAGALGSMLHAVQSFLDFHGNRRLARSWLPWYVMRPFVGALLALIFYLLLRGGLVAGASPSGDAQVPVNLIGLIGAAALVGMFSDLASLKLKEVFTTLFATALKTQRADPLPTGTTTAKPRVSDTDPRALTRGKPVNLTVRGTNFVKESKVAIDGNARETRFVSSEELTAALEAADVADAGTRVLTVVSPKDRGGISEGRGLPVA